MVIVAIFFCVMCFIEGEYSKEFRKIVFKTTSKEELRSYDDYEKLIAEKISMNCKHFKGISGRSQLSYIEYLNIYKSCSIDGMHGPIGGVCKRLFEFMLDPLSKDKKCHIDKESAGILHRRLMNFGSTLDFKRFPRDLNLVSEWKMNEYFQFLFYESPIIFKDVLDKECYNHWLVFVYSLSKLWEGNVTKNELDVISQLLKSFIDDIDNLYGEKEHTPNMHNIIHLTLCVLNLGPLKEYNAFIFEHFNSYLKKSTHSSYAVNHQIADDYGTKFLLN